MTDLTVDDFLKSHRTFALVGVEISAIVECFEKRSRKLYGHTPGMYVVEPDAEKFIAYRDHPDILPILRSPDVYWFVGEDCLKQLEDFLAAELEVVPPYHYHSPSGLLLDTAIRDGLKRRDDTLSGEKAVNAVMYNGGSKTAMQKFRPLILVSRFTSVNRWVGEEMLLACNKVLSDAALLTEEHDAGEIRGFDIVSAIRTFVPSHILTINWTREGLANVVPDGLPIWTWARDPGSAAYRKDSYRLPCDRVFAFSRSMQQGLLDAGWPEAPVLSCAVTADFFSPGPTTVQARCDVATFTDILHPSLARDDATREAWRERVLSRALPVRRLWRAKPRIEVLAYGRGWNHWPAHEYQVAIPLRPTARVLSMGNLNPLGPMRAALRGTRITIQQAIHTHITSRLFEAILCGSFPLLNRLPLNPGCEDLNEALGGRMNDWVGFYDGRGDVVERVRYYLDREDYRRYDTEAADYIREHHSYVKRVEFLRDLAVKPPL